MLRRTNVAAACICCLLTLTGCALNQKIKYNLNDITPSAEQTRNDYSLSIECFDDMRCSVPENDILFTNGRTATVKGRTVYLNSEKHYKEPGVPAQIADIIANHINKRKTFHSIMIDMPEDADFYVTGTLKNFYGMQEYSAGAATGAQFGLVGALVTAGIESDAVIHIGFADLKLYAKDGTLIKDLGNLDETFTERLPVDGYGWSVYWNVNAKLKEVVAKLVRNIEAAVNEYAKAQ